jgi:hypothetical protein
MALMKRVSVGAIAMAVLCAAAPGAQQRLTRQDGDRFQSKLIQIVRFGTTPPRARAAKATEITDAEINSYFRYNAKDQIPTGIVDPVLNAVGNGRITGRAIVDLDAVRSQKQRGWLDPLGYLTGKLPVTAAGLLSTQNGVGRFQLESASISGVTIPKTVLQELLSYYSRSPENPAGINMDEPFELPARIREIKVGQGQATIVQ